MFDQKRPKTNPNSRTAMDHHRASVDRIHRLDASQEHEEASTLLRYSCILKVKKEKYNSNLVQQTSLKNPGIRLPNWPNSKAVYCTCIRLNMQKKLKN